MSLSSYRPVSLISAPCKMLEKVALGRLEWISGQLEFFPEQSTSFRRHRCTADSISDVVATVEDAKSCSDVTMLLLLDVESAPTVFHMSFVTAFLTSRTFRLRVGKNTSQPRGIIAGVPQGSVLSPFFFNMMMAGLPAFLPTGTSFPARCSVHADDVALWARVPRWSIPAIRRSLQAALDAVTTYVSSVRLKVSATETESLLIDPLAAARRYVKHLRVGNRNLPWKLTGAISKLQQPGRGCSTKLALQLNQASASSVLLHTFPLVALTRARRLDLEGHYRRAVRAFLELPRYYPVAATLAKTGEWPLSLHMLQRVLGHVDQLPRAAYCSTLMERLRSQLSSQMDSLCAVYHQMVPDPLAPLAPAPPHHVPLDIHLSLGGATKRGMPAAALQ
ncbi:uncharacterized protein LOC142814130 [Rhipicephalus microplus]|uniref:uncharacterized protein LOC142814130 n=1 Tax=Rhipicephalus microplus TaxID=6941 RepID=UPI003F6B9323